MRRSTAFPQWPNILTAGEEEAGDEPLAMQEEGRFLRYCGSLSFYSKDGMQTDELIIRGTNADTPEVEERRAQQPGHSTDPVALQL